MGNSISKAGYLRESFRYFHLRDSAGQELDFHFHEFDKLVILLSGTVDYSVEGNVYRLRPWDVLLVRHHCIHKAEIDRSAPYERIIIYLDGGYFKSLMPRSGLMDCFDAADRHQRYLVVPNAQQLQTLCACLDAFEQARGDSRFASEALMETYIIQLLIHLGRMRETGPLTAERERDFDPKIRSALSYINENFRRGLDVAEVAEHVFLSKYHFMRLFKEQTGQTVHGCITEKRLLHAARLIRAGRPAAEAAIESGFTDYSAFYRAFKESFGTSPGRLSAGREG